VKTSRPEDLDRLRSHLATTLARIQGAPSSGWHISEDEHRLMVTLAELTDLSLPTDAFRSHQGAIDFLRAARMALGQPPPPLQGRA
jgi:hypothetical protein